MIGLLSRLAVSHPTSHFIFIPVFRRFHNPMVWPHNQLLNWRRMETTLEEYAICSVGMFPLIENNLSKALNRPKRKIIRAYFWQVLNVFPYKRSQGLYWTIWRPNTIVTYIVMSLLALDANMCGKGKVFFSSICVSTLLQRGSTC